jgi:hypothetical protein
MLRKALRNILAYAIPDCSVVNKEGLGIAKLDVSDCLATGENSLRL